MNINEDNDEMQLIVQISHTEGTVEERLGAAIAELPKALDLIEESLTDRAFYFRGISVDIGPPSDQLGTDLMAIADKRLASDGPHSPWQLTNLTFWATVAEHPQFNGQIEEILARYEAITKGHYASKHEEVWATETAQLGEAELAALALADGHFVRWYSRFLLAWDLLSEISQFDVIHALIERYGLCSETEELLMIRCVKAPGQHEDKQLDRAYPYLQAAYGDVANSAFFIEIVTANYAKQKAEGMAETFPVFQNSEHPNLAEKARQLRD